MAAGRKIGRTIMEVMGVVVPSITFVIIFLTFMISIISRYCLNTPVTWSYEISVLAYMWTMFFGVGKAMETDDHVVFGLIYDTLKPMGQMIFKVFYNGFLLVLLVITFIPCVESLVSKQMVTGVLKLPYTVIFAPFIWMMAEIIVRSGINIYQAVKEYKGKEGGTK